MSAFTTSQIFIGCPEAEAEANYNSRVLLEEVFLDYLNVIPDINTQMFIVIGKKGSGKTAIGQHLLAESRNVSDIFCQFIRKQDIDFEVIVQLCNDKGELVQIASLFEWIILIKMIKLILQNEAIKRNSQIKLIELFLHKNSGYVEINNFQIKETIRTKGASISIEYLNRFFKAEGKQELQLKGVSAPFYTLIPHLKEVIRLILTEPSLQFNKYSLIFDDLDISFKESDSSAIETLCCLIRTSKDYNNNFFAENNINAKIILLLRDDISNVLIRNSADMSKIFSSYGIPLIWMQSGHEQPKLKKFIDARISLALRKANIVCEKSGWEALIDADDEVHETSFKYVTDHTFYNPRDLILFFKPLSERNFRLPLSKKNLNYLIGIYSREMKGEIDNSLSLYFTGKQINSIWATFKRLSDFEVETFTYTKLLELLIYFGFELESERIAWILIEYSLIGIKKPFCKPQYMFRNNLSKLDFTNPSVNLVIHKIISIFFKNSLESPNGY